MSRWSDSTAVGIAFRRAAADRALLVATGATVLLAAVLMASGPIYAEAVTRSALVRVLDDAPVQEANVEVEARFEPGDLTTIEAQVRAEIDRVFSPVEHTVHESAVANSYELTGLPTGERVDLAAFHYFEAIEAHADLVSGRWPVDGSGVIQVALPDQVSTGLGLSVGDEIVVVNRRERSEQRTITVSGVYAARPDDDFWYGEPLLASGSTEGRTFTTHGPFVVTREALLRDLTVVSARFRWRVFIGHDSLTADDIPLLTRDPGGMEDRINDGLDALITGVGEYRGVRVETGLRPLLSDTDRSLATTRSVVAMLWAQLAVLAGFALVFVAGTVAEARQVQTRFLRSRGASPCQLLGLSLIEAALLTVPAAVVAPELASLLLRLLNRVGPLSSIGLTLEPQPTRSAFALTAVAAAACAVALAVPAYRSARRFPETGGEANRQRASTLLQGAGLDIAILVLAVVGFWQLDVHSEALTASIRGRFSVDPLLVAAPALGLAAGAFLSLRVLPLLAHLLELVAARAKSTVPAMSAWQAARRPRKHARSALLLVVAVGVGVFSLSASATWARSQEDQADFEVGAAVRAVLNRSEQHPLADLQASNALNDLAAVESAMAVARLSGPGSETAAIPRFLALDAASAPQTSLIRSDLGPGFTEAMARLRDERPQLPAIALPGEPDGLAVALDVAVDPIAPEERVAEGSTDCFCPSVSVVIQDGDGLLTRLALGRVPVDTGPRRIEADLHLDLSPTSTVTPRYPLSLVGIEVKTPTSRDLERTATVVFGGVYTREDGGDWRLATPNLDAESWLIAGTPVLQPIRDASIVPVEVTADGLALAVTAGQSFAPVPPPVVFGLRPVGDSPTGPFSVVATSRFVQTLGIAIGDELQLPGLRLPVDHAKVTATITDFPTVTRELGEAVLVDLPTLQALNYRPGERILGPDEYWLRTVSGTSDEVVTRLLASPYDAATAVGADAIADRNKSELVALGAIGALSVGSAAASLFAVVGFAVSAIVWARDRRHEFALLRAVGFSNTQLAGGLAAEYAILVVMSLTLGTAAGVLLSWVSLPLLSVTPDGTAALPQVLVAYPIAQIAALNLAVLLTLCVVVAVLALGLRRSGFTPARGSIAP